MPFLLIVHVPGLQIGKQLQLLGPKKHLLPHFLRIMVRLCVPGATHPRQGTFLL